MIVYIRWENGFIEKFTMKKGNFSYRHKKHYVEISDDKGFTYSMTPKQIKKLCVSEKEYMNYCARSLKNEIDKYEQHMCRIKELTAGL